MRRFCKYLLAIYLMMIYSCGTPNDPEEFSGSGGYKIVSKFPTSGYAQDVIIEDTLAYIAQGEGGLLIMSISDPGNPKEIKTISENLKGYAYKIVKKDSAVYLAAGNFGVSIVNVADPYNPKVALTNLGIKPARDMIIHKNYLLSTVSELGINISEISFPVEPDIRGGISTPGYARGLCTTPDSNYLLVSCGEMGIAMIDVTDMQNGFGIYPKVGWSDTRGYAMDVTCHPELPYAFLACGEEGLIIMDYSDSLNIKEVSSYRTGGYAKEIEYEDGKIFLTTEGRGLQVFDVSNITSPVRIAAVNTKYAMGLALTEDYIFIADEIEGFIIIRRP